MLCTEGVRRTLTYIVQNYFHLWLGEIDELQLMTTHEAGNEFRLQRDLQPASLVTVADQVKDLITKDTHLYL